MNTDTVFTRKTSIVVSIRFSIKYLKMGKDAKNEYQVQKVLKTVCVCVHEKEGE